MSGYTDIEWCRTYHPDGSWTPGRTWNPVSGCSKVSLGCQNCYAEKVATRWWGERKFTDVRMHPERLLAPLKWSKPVRVFVNSMSDLFHGKVPFDFVLKVWSTMAISPQHTFIILTKRPARMLAFFEWAKVEMKKSGLDESENGLVVLPNVWLGVSVENQQRADERIALLLQCPAAVRLLSCEPLLGPLEIEPWLTLSPSTQFLSGRVSPAMPAWTKIGSTRVDWVIVGGESGPGARPMQTDWARSLRDQCQAARAAFFFKQWGEWGPYNLSRDRAEELAKLLNPKTFDFPRRHGKKLAGRLLDGREWNEFPALEIS